MKVEGLDGKLYPARRVPMDQLNRRRAAVLFLREKGWSIRRIAAEVGWSAATIYRDLQHEDAA